MYLLIDACHKTNHRTLPSARIMIHIHSNHHQLFLESSNKAGFKNNDFDQVQEE